MGADIFTTRAPAVSYAEQGVPPPSALYIGPNETLVVDTWSSTAPAALAIVARVLRPGGEVHTSRWSHTPNTDRTRATTYHLPEEGYLLSVAVDATGAAYRRGHCWCQVGIQIGDGAAGVPHGQLIADYVTGTARLAWPGGQLRQSTEGPGLIRSVTGADPAAGADISETVPAGSRWRLISLRATLTTDATVLNRVVTLLSDDGALVYHQAPSDVTQPAGTAYSYCAAQGMRTGFPASLPVGLALPVDHLLAAGYRVRTSTASLQAGDNWGAPQMLVEEWIEP